MGQIYRRAFMVIAWLGLGYDEALSLIQNALEDMTAQLRTSTDGYSIRREMERLIIARPVLRSSFGTVSKSDYWSRLWIVQEFVANPRLRMGSGRLLLDVDAILHPLRGVVVTDGFVVDALHSFFSYPAYRVLHSRRRHVTKAKGWYGWNESHNLIRIFKDVKCVDVRDHVFRLVGLVDKDELRAYPIIVNYSQAVTTLFFKMCERRKQQLLDEEIARVIRRQLGRFADDLRDALQLPRDFGLEDGVPSLEIDLKRASRYVQR